MAKMEMTIKQLADELGTNKMTIHRVINKLGLQGQLHKIDNRYMLSESQAAQIRSIVLEQNVTNQDEQNVTATHKTQYKAIKIKNKSYQIKQNETYQQKSNETYHHDLQLSILNEQLVAKDNQIQMLQNQLIAKDGQIAEKDEQIKLLQQQLIAKDNQIGQITVSVNSLLNILLLSSHPMKRNSQNRNKDCFQDCLVGKIIIDIKIAEEKENE